VTRATPARTNTFALMLRAGSFYLGLIVLTLLFVPLCFILWPLPFRHRFKLVGYWARCNLFWLKVTCNLAYRLEGEENIPSTPTIVMCKHQSAWETIAIIELFLPQVWVLKRELFRIPVLGWGLATLRPIGIDRSAGATAAKQILEQGTERLASSCWVVIFPEGTRVAAGTRGRYRTGAARLASSTGYPVVPVAHNAGDYWPRKSFLKSPGTIRMVVGPVIDSTGKRSAQITREVEEWIEETVARLRAEDGFDTSYYELSGANTGKGS
jgi:1-acyl-sn-glycerol-3-phosphate acyltransferase